MSSVADDQKTYPVKFGSIYSKDGFGLSGKGTVSIDNIFLAISGRRHQSAILKALLFILVNAVVSTFLRQIWPLGGSILGLCAGVIAWISCSEAYFAEVDYWKIRNVERNGSVVRLERLDERKDNRTRVNRIRFASEDDAVGFENTIASKTDQPSMSA